MRAKSMAILLAVLFLYVPISACAYGDDARWVENAASKLMRRADCGFQSLAFLLTGEGKIESAAAVGHIQPASAKGVSVQELVDLANQHGYRLHAFRSSADFSAQIPTPAIIHHFTGKDGAGGHFQVLEAINASRAMVYDAQQKHHLMISLAELNRTWSGVFLSSDKPPEDATYGRLTEATARAIYGGYDSVAQAEAGQGDLGGRPDRLCGGAPAWFVNTINFNLVVADVPLWYQPALGPSVSFRITYNSRDTATANAPFGRKWRFIYSASLIEDTSTGVVTVVLGDGKQQQFAPDGSGGYTPAYETFNRLVKIGDNHFEMRTPRDTVYRFQIPAGSGLTTPYLVQLSNPRGQGLVIGYDSAGQLTGIQDALGRTTTLSYTDGKVTQVVDPFGRQADFEYSGDDLTRVTDMGGVWAVFTYDANANLTGIEKERGLTTFAIEGGGDPNSATYPPPGANLGAHRRVTISDPLGNKEEYYYNGLVGYGWYVSPRAYVEYVDADVNNSAASVAKTLYYYEDTAKGVREAIGSVLYPEGRQVARVHDFDTGQVLSVSDSFGSTTTYTYNPMGRVTTITPEIGAATTHIYDANNLDLVESRIEGLGSVYMTYNAFHEVTQTVDRVGKQTDMVYDSNGLMTSMTQVHDDHSIATDAAYYAAGHAGAFRLQQVTRAGQTVAQYTYDAVGRLQTLTDAAGLTTTYTYNNLNQVTAQAHADGRWVQYTYSSCCPRLIDSVTDRAGRVTYYEYDALERLVKTINPEGGQQLFEYDPNGNLITFTNPNKNQTRFEYDLDNRMTRRIWADGRSLAYRYDAAGRLERRIDGRGIWTFYSYDANDNLIHTYYTDGTPVTPTARLR